MLGGAKEQYDSAVIAAEMLHCIACVVRNDKVLDFIRASPVFGEMFDETTDVSTKSQMNLNGVGIKPDGYAGVCFLGLEELPNGTSATILEAVLHRNEKDGISTAKLAAVGTDGASPLMGRLKGVQALLRRMNTLLFGLHCANHKIPLACEAAAKLHRYICLFYDYLGTLARFYKNSVRLPVTTPHPFALLITFTPRRRASALTV